MLALTPISRASSSGVALCGGSNLPTALSLNACPYRANWLLALRPRGETHGSGPAPEGTCKAVHLWTMRCAHRPACRGQRFALPTTQTFDHNYTASYYLHELRTPESYRGDNYSDAGGGPHGSLVVADKPPDNSFGFKIAARSLCSISA
nr:hypothetical protein [Paracidovorax citrulli]